MDLKVKKIQSKIFIIFKLKFGELTKNINIIGMILSIIAPISLSCSLQLVFCIA